MLKIHKGLKKKKKDKKNKHKEDDLFNQEELDKYRKEHSKPVASAEPDLGQPSNSGDQSDEWQKFKALTAGVDTILQKTQEDLDRIKSTSFFQRKPPPSEVERQKEEERQEAEEQYAKEHPDGDGEHPAQQQSADGAVDFAHKPKAESEDESEEIEVDDTLFDTSYVDAVASGELKLAYIPDSPTEKEDDDPFDTSYANKFIESNPKKRYLNLGCAVQVLSGRQSIVSAESTSPAVFGDKKSRRRRPKPVDLLLTSFDEGADSQTAVPAVVERTPVDSPVRTLLDEDSLLVKDDDLPPLAVTPIPAPPPPASTPVNPVTAAAKKEPKLDLSDFELDEFDVLAATNSSSCVSGGAAAAILDLHKQPSNESTDDEFAQLAAESLARKSSSALPTPNDPSTANRTVIREPIKSFDATTPTTDFISVDPLQPIAPPEQEEIDPFDTSIVAHVILPGKQEIKLLEKELLSDITVCDKVAAGSKVDDIDDDDFDPRAGESFPVKAIRPQELLIKHKAQVEKIVSPSKKPDFLKIEDVDVEVTKPLTPLAAVKQDEPLDSEYDPFDTSHVCGAPGKLELKLIENELSKKDDDEDDDFDPRKYDGVDRAQSTATSLTRSILTKYACNPPPENQPQPVDPVAIDILTGREEDADAVHIFSTPVEPEKYVIESPDIAFSDPFDTSIAENIQPGKVELKLLETELISKN